MKYFITACVLILTQYIFANQPYRTQMIANDIASLQVNVTGQDFSFPVIQLGSNQTIDISFDQLSYDVKSYYYKIIHCDAQWYPSAISEMDYLSGFSTGSIDDYEYSINTSVSYIHYYIQLPTDQTRLLLSGNYAVVIAEDYNFDQPTAIACFSLYESIANITGEVRGNTDLEINRRYQQLDIDVDYARLTVRDPMSDFFLAVYQNGRFDNAALGLKPTFLQNHKVIYKSNKALIFEGGNSYRTIDFSSEYTYGLGIDKIQYIDQTYHVQVEPSTNRNQVNPDLTPDADGAMVINKQGSDYPSVEADYFWVHFSLPWTNPLPQGGVYIMGDFNHNRFDSFVRMEYQNGVFYKSILLKQGGYNFQYVVMNSADKSISLQPIEGSYWQTQNSYQIFLFYKPFGARYDRLIGYKVIQ